MDLSKINYSAGTSKVEGKQQVKDNQTTVSENPSEQESTKLLNFEQSASAIAGINVQSPKTEPANNNSGNIDIKDFVKHCFNLKKIQKTHNALQDKPQVLAELHTTPGYGGKLMMHKADLESMKEIHRALKDQPKVLAQIHTTKSTSGKLPIHIKAYHPEALKEIDETFKDQPEVLAQIHTTKDDFGNLPMHYADLDGMKEIHRALKDQPEVLAQIHTTQGFGRQLPIHKADLDGVKEIHEALKDQPQVLAKMHMSSDLSNKFPIKHELPKIFIQAIFQSITNKLKQD